MIRKLKRTTVRKLKHNESKDYLNFEAEDKSELVPIKNMPLRLKYEPVPFQKTPIEVLEAWAKGDGHLKWEKDGKPVIGLNHIPDVTLHNVSIERQVNFYISAK